ncbi:UNVERIFIED_CONTAM: hypothetical protein Cloal_3372 [Acetivibrio alkalicellulosi]
MFLLIKKLKFLSISIALVILLIQSHVFAHRNISEITDNNILIVGQYAFDLNDSQSGYNLNNYLKAVQSAYFNEVSGKYEIYYRVGGHWYDLVGAEYTGIDQLVKVDENDINGDGTYTYWNMEPLFTYESTTLIDFDISVDFATILEDVLEQLFKTIEITGSKGELAIASIEWTIDEYEPEIAGEYLATGEILLPEYWTGEPANVSANITVEEKLELTVVILRADVLEIEEEETVTFTLEYEDQKGNPIVPETGIISYKVLDEDDEDAEVQDNAEILTIVANEITFLTSGNFKIIATVDGVDSNEVQIKVQKNSSGSGDLIDIATASNFVGALYIRDNNIYYSEIDNDENWSNEYLIGAGKEGKVVIDSNGNPHVAYTTDEDKIGYRMYAGEQWSDVLIIESNNGGICKWPDIDVDNNDNPHIIYVDTMGDTAGTQNQPDVMYAHKSNGVFSKTLLYSGNYDSGWKQGVYPAEKPPQIALDSNNNYYVFYQWRSYDHGMGVYHDRGLSIVGSTTQNLGYVGSNTNRFDIYGLEEINNKLYALYRDNTNIKLSELNINSTTGEITSKNDIVDFGASSAYSFAINNNDVVIGSKQNANLLIHFNETTQVFDDIEVKGNAVCVVFINDSFYAFYTDNTDNLIKKLEIN